MNTVILDGVSNLWSWFKGLFIENPPSSEPTTIEYRGMTGYFSGEMIDEFKAAGVDYERAFRESVDEVLQEAEENKENPYT